MQLTKSVKALFLALAGVLLHAGCGGKADDKPPLYAPPKTGSPSAASPYPNWEPDAKLLDELGPASDVAEYQVRPPKGYDFNPLPPGPPAGLKGGAWAGALRNNQTAPQFMIGIVTSPDGADKMTAQLYLDKMLGGIKQQRTNWTQTTLERGQINGLTFFRIYWTGTELRKRWKMHGFMYAAQ